MHLLTIRNAVVEDIAAMLEMLQESAIDQGFPGEVVVTADDLRSDGFGPHPRFRALIGELDVATVGMALFYINYSTWGSRLGLYLEDFYVRPEARGRGVARALFHQLAAIAVAEGCGRFQWIVHAENQRAFGFYRSMGAEVLPDWKPMSLGASDLLDLAERPSLQ